MNSQTLAFVPLAEQDQISRAMLTWLNEYPDKPTDINFESVPVDGVGMAMSVIQGAYITRKYVRGRYQAQYQFKLIYRIKPGGSNNARLKAVELLNQIGDWAMARLDYPDIGVRRKVQRVEVNARAALFAQYEGGDEDYQILMTMYYVAI